MEEQLTELERGFWDSAGDGQFYREHFSDDGMCVFSFGAMDKQATMAAAAQAQPWTDVRFDDVRVVTLAPDTAALVYGAKARRGEDGAPYEAAISSVYVRQGGRWLLALHQQTPLG